MPVVHAMSLYYHNEWIIIVYEMNTRQIKIDSISYNHIISGDQ